MSAPARPAVHALPAPPELAFAVDGAGVLEHAAAPTLRFDLRIESSPAVAIRSLSLAVQIRLATTRRGYTAEAQRRLVELFGEPQRWGHTLRSLLWTNVSLLVPAFTGSTTAQLAVPCTYDLDVASARYLRALEDGEVPLELLFSGTIFYAGPSGELRIAHVPWDREAEFRLPARLWHEMMDRYFPGSAWIRLPRETFDRLHAYRAARGLPGLEAVIADLLEPREGAAGS